MAMFQLIKSGMLFWTILLLSLISVISAVEANDTAVVGGDFEAAFQGKCGPSSPCVQLCVELHDGTFECQCRPGYRLLLDGYSCVELGNSTYSDDDEENDSDEFDSELDFNSPNLSAAEREKERSRYRAAKAKAAAAAAAAAALPTPLRSIRPLPRPLASSPLLPSRTSRDNDAASAAAVALEARERNNYLKKFSPIDGDDEAGRIFDLKEGATGSNSKGKGGTNKAPSGVKGKGKGFYLEDDEYGSPEQDSGDDDDDEDENEEDEDDEDSTNEAEEDLGSLERSSSTINTAKEPGGGGEEDDESDEDFILPPRALPLKDTSYLSSSTPSVPLANSPLTSQGSVETSLPSLSEDNAPPAPLNGETDPDCPLKCNRGQCTKELVDENSSMDDRLNIGFRCLCPMGTRGTFCENVELFEEGGGYNSGLFRGQSWVAFPVLHDAYMSDQISLEFRPQSPNGILLLTGERDDLSGDYLALFLRDGYLEFRFDCGSGSGMVRSSFPVNLQQWNKASIVRRRWDGWMQLNDGPFTQGRSKGLFSRITFRQPVYIGGQGNITFNSVSSIQSNFDEEPELVISSSTTNVNNYTATLGPLTSSSTPTATISPSPPSSYDSSSSSSNNLLPQSQSPQQQDNSFGQPQPPLPQPSSSVASSSSSSVGLKNEDDPESLSTVSILRGIGGFQGCIRNLVINDRVYRFGLEPAGDSLQGFDVENCNDQGVCDLVKCQHGGQCLVQKDENPTCLCPLGFSGPLCETPLDLQIPSFNGSSYLKYGGLGLTRVLSWLELEIVIKPDAMDGLIMYNGYKTDGMGDFISLVIDQGYIEFAMDLGTGTAIIRSDAPVALGEWHHVHVSRTSRLISLRIDNQPPLMALTPGAFTQLSLPHNLFLGGIPDPQWLSPKVKVHGGFSGCIQKLVINEKPLRIMGSAMSGVNLENCAHPCLRNPCDHGGDCIPQLDTFKCHCPLGYRDPYCQTRMDKEDVITAPRFIGDSYLRFTHTRIIKRLSGWRLNLSFRLKTDLSRGLLVWAGRKWMTSASDFISMGLRNGFITASFSLGSGQITIAYNFTSVNDGQWHRVHLIRNEQEASLSVDDGPPVTGMAPGKLRQLNINDGLYIGGLEDARHQSMNRYTEGFVGCLTDLILGSERVSLLQEASEGRNVDYCD